MTAQWSEMTFVFWEIMPDGTAEACLDDDRVNANPSRFYGSIEGAIIHGGVRATAFERKTEEVFDAMAWLKTGERISAGFVTTTTITAERE